MRLPHSVLVTAVLTVLAFVMVPMANAASLVTQNSVTLAWTAPGDDSLLGGATQYDIRYSTAPITASNFLAATAVASPPSPAASGTAEIFTLTGLSPSTTYYFSIRTLDDASNWSGISNVVSKTTLAAPDVIRPAPTATLGVTALTDTTATLGWTAVGNDSLTGTASSYDIRYSLSPITASSWATATQVTGEPAPTAPGTTQSYQVRNLARQTAYYFAIKTADAAGNVSALSNTPSGTTTDTMAPAAIRDLVASFVWLAWHTATAHPAAAGASR